MHGTPRRELYAPDRCDDKPVIPEDQIDMYRLTHTNLDTADDRRIEDLWDGGIEDQW